MSENKQVVSQLLESVRAVRIKYESVGAEQRFNIFSVIREGHEEVGLHSAMLHELLNPKGSHGHGNEFLSLFFEQLEELLPNLKPEKEFSKAVVKKEKAFHNGDDEAGQIDIFIETDNIVCAVENKITEEDRPKQLAKYKTYLLHQTIRGTEKEKTPLLLYLTLKGDDPTQVELSEESNLVLLSYEQHIHKWLSKCLERVALEPLIRESIRQYQILIERLTGNTMAVKEKEEVIDEIGKREETIDAARAVYEAWPKAVAQGVLKFWEELESRVVDMAGETSILRKQEYYTEDKIKHLVERNSFGKRLTPFGLLFSVGLFEGDHVCIFIVTPWESEGIKYGITIVRYDSTGPEQGRRDINNDPKYNPLIELFERNNLIRGNGSRNNWWLDSTKISDDVPNIRYLKTGKSVPQLMLQGVREKSVETVIRQVKPLYDGLRSTLAENQ